MFTLHERLLEDTRDIIPLAVSRVLLMNDSSFPWLILVPERAGVREMYDLGQEDRAIFIEEVSLASEIIQQLFAPDKINIGALGNLVPQLHMHVVGRFRNDRAWPGPVWGSGPAIPYAEKELDTVCGRIQRAFQQKDSAHVRL